MARIRAPLLAPINRISLDFITVVKLQHIPNHLEPIVHSLVTIHLGTVRRHQRLQNRPISIGDLMDCFLRELLVKSNFLVNAHHRQAQVGLGALVPHCLQLNVFLAKIRLESLGHPGGTL